MKFWRFIFFPFAILFVVITGLRNLLYHFNIKRSIKYSVPTINVGNLSMGGTGKTPHIEYLIRLLKPDYNVATLSRGFGRKEKGFIIANNESTAFQIGDEPLQYYKKFGHEITVAVDIDRVNGVKEICFNQPNTNVILLDDAYQHRSIKPGLNILLTDYNQPFWKDCILPVGNLRELKWGKKRADIIVVTKCPNFNSINKAQLIKDIKPAKHQTIFFSKINYNPTLTPFFGEISQLNPLTKYAIVVTGIANAKPLIDFIGKRYQILKHLNFSDHYQFKENDIDDIHKLLVKFAEHKPIIITTEKDAMRLYRNDWKEKLIDKPWFYQSIEIEIDDTAQFDKKIKDYVQKDSRNYGIHS
jgi:tetraacyldisaccharide 4'-kinase